MATSARKKRNAIAQAEREERQRIEIAEVRRQKAEAQAERQRQREAEVAAAAAVEAARLKAASRRKSMRSALIVASFVAVIVGAAWGVTWLDSNRSESVSAAAPESSPEEEEDAAPAESSTTSAYAVTSRDEIAYYVALQELDEQLAQEDEDDLISLGDSVCGSLSNGNSQETVIEMLGIIGSPYGVQTDARIVAAADRFLC